MTSTRRRMLASAVFAVASLSFAALSPAANAQDSGASGFVQGFGNKLVAVVNADSAMPAKEQQLRPLIDQAVDVDAIAKFCLGRFVNTATPAQMSEFTRLFHGVLVNNITSKIGEYRGVTFRMTDTSMRGSEAYVGTVVQRPNNAPTNVRWVVSSATGSPKIVDVVAEGTSLRLTQRSDYASFLSHNSNNLDALLAAMRRQVSTGG
ncbi:phospholipid-binding protein MlaC [Acidisphaera sp. L21]|uniref:MlaC/ttg2D family ABC transporter substrate-binding protein n=1 Tax=Acidisphaera sp. L21 TaxID=1641851 RepID=UPI00131DDEFB|nr:ABC transporter substrate-binding protein [Acidisphaera sp. L21]